MKLRINIDCSKIEKKYLKENKYLVMNILPSKYKQKDTDADYFVSQAIPSDIRVELDLDEKTYGAILGNAWEQKEYNAKNQNVKSNNVSDDIDDDIPF